MTGVASWFFCPPPPEGWDFQGRSIATLAPVMAVMDRALDLGEIVKILPALRAAHIY